MDSPEELLVPITHVQVLAGLQGRGTNHTTCQLLGCGCSMCKLSTWPLDHLNYSSFEGGERGASSGDAQSSLALTFDKLLPYKRISYVTQGSTVKIHCNLGHRIDSHDPGAPRSQAVACNFSHRNEFGFESLTQSSSNEGSGIKTTIIVVLELRLSVAVTLQAGHVRCLRTSLFSRSVKGVVQRSIVLL